MDYNPLAPEVQDNPYPYYAELRDKAPVAWIESMQGWAVSRYADVDFIFRNPRLFSSALWNTTASGDLVVVPEAPGLLSMDPPDHTRMRKLANKGFTPRLIREMEPRVRTITQDLLKPLSGQVEADLVSALSVPLPIIVIAEMLGIELARQATQDVELEGGKLPAGATVLLLLGAANRDERKFPEPDRFDVARNPQDHVGFGYGIHYCLGAPLARLEGRVALEALLFDCPPFTRVLAQVPRIAAYLVRGPRTLPLRFAITRRAVA